MKKKTYAEVKKTFEDRGYKLLSTEYINSKSRLEYICPKGHRGTITFGSFQMGRGCKVCGVERATKKNISILNREASKRRIPIDKIRAEFEEYGFQLLSNLYKNVQTPLEYICPKGHKGITNYKSFHKHHGCSQCANEAVGEKVWKNRRKTLEDVKKESVGRSEEILKSFYRNGRHYITFRCSEGHIRTVTYNSFKRGSGCKICAQRLNGRKRIDITAIYDNLSIDGYVVLENLEKTYKTNKTKLKLKCPNNHVFYMRFNDFQQGHRCPICSNRNSKAEQEIFDFIKQYFEDSYQHDRKLIPPYELDIVIPSKKIAVEYCGLYWHSEQAGKDKNYHYNKYEKCQEVGYRLITIFEDEWEKHKDIVLSRLVNILSISGQEIIFARKCDIREIETKVKNEFLDNNHIQGRDKSKIKIGAFSEDRLVSVMTFSIPSIAKGGKAEEGVLELNRFCSEKGIVCTGIASRMFRYFVTNYNPKEVFSYADIRWSEGNLYKKLGFNFVGRSNPNYWYIDGQDRIHRFNFRKSVLEKKLDNFSESLTEVENMVNNGFTRIWDCGNLKFVKCFR